MTVEYRQVCPSFGEKRGANLLAVTRIQMNQSKLMNSNSRRFEQQWVHKRLHHGQERLFVVYNGRNRMNRTTKQETFLSERFLLKLKRLDLLDGERVSTHRRPSIHMEIESNFVRWGLLFANERGLSLILSKILKIYHYLNSFQPSTTGMTASRVVGGNQSWMNGYVDFIRDLFVTPWFYSK